MNSVCFLRVERLYILLARAAIGRVLTHWNFYLGDPQAESRKRRMLLDSNHVLPESMNYERETKLRKMANKGVVALFNAVRKQQKDEEEVSQGTPGLSHGFGLFDLSDSLDTLLYT